MHGQTGYKTRPHARLPLNSLRMNASMTSQLSAVLIRKLRGSSMYLLIFGMSCIGVCTTSHWQTSGQLVEELSVCTVGLGSGYISSKRAPIKKKVALIVGKIGNDFTNQNHKLCTCMCVYVCILIFPSCEITSKTKLIRVRLRVKARIG